MTSDIAKKTILAILREKGEETYFNLTEAQLYEKINIGQADSISNHTAPGKEDILEYLQATNILNRGIHIESFHSIISRSMKRHEF